MRLINKKVETRRMNRRVDVFNGGFVSVLAYLLFFLLFANVVLYMM